MNYKLALGYGIKLKTQSGEVVGLAGAEKWAFSFQILSILIIKLYKLEN